MTEATKRYLIIGPSWVGDMVMAQSFFIDLKQREPNSIIDVLAPAWTAALIDRMPQVRNLIQTNFQHGKLSLLERYRLGKSLREKGYTNAITLPNSLKSALVPAIAKIPIRTGFVGEQRWGFLNDIRRLDKTKLPMTVQRFIALGRNKNAFVPTTESIAEPQLKIDQSAVNNIKEKFALSNNHCILALCPGAEFGISKQWPMEHYAQLAQHYLDQGWDIWLLGSQKDKFSCDEINLKTGKRCSVLAGKTSLPEAIDLLSMADLAVSNDSGLMHIAAALQTPLVAIYGSTDPQHTPPLSKNHVIAKLDLTCSPCFKRDCPLDHHDCLQKLTPQTVIMKAQSIIL